MKTRVLIVDDSAVVRKVFKDHLAASRDIEVVGTAPDPYVARDMIVAEQPDVLLLDIEMPRMDGITFLRKLMQHRPLPVIIVSSLTPQGSELALEALDCGAVDVMCKPGSSFSVGNIVDDLVERIKLAAQTRIRKKAVAEGNTIKPKKLHLAQTTDKVLAIGASTGGTRAIEDLLRQFPINAPGTVIVQHMPPYFTKTFSERLNSICDVEVREARKNDSVQPGQVLIAPGGLHMVLRRSGARYYVDVKDGPLVHHQRPAVEVLFRSVAKYAGPNSIGVILTGMGADGAEGLLEMKNTGAYTIAQDEATSVVYGMPGVAAKIGAACEITPLDKIAARIMAHV
jgi:two-component system chemotaxis response regulator CheB